MAATAENQVFDEMLRFNQMSQALCSPTRAKMDQDVLSSEKQKPKKTCDVCAKKNNEESHWWGEGGGWGGRGSAGAPRPCRTLGGPSEDPWGTLALGDPWARPSWNPWETLGGPLMDPWRTLGGPLEAPQMTLGGSLEDPWWTLGGPLGRTAEKNLPTDQGSQCVYTRTSA